jgi:hypothetical protein
MERLPYFEPLAPYMWRDYAHGTYAWIGHLDHENLDALINSRGHATEHLCYLFQCKRTGHLLSALSSHDLHTERTETHVVEPGGTQKTITWSVDEKHNTRDVVNEIERLNG